MCNYKKILGFVVVLWLDFQLILTLRFLHFPQAISSVWNENNKVKKLLVLLNDDLFMFLYYSCWQVMLVTAVHRQTLSAGSWSDYWCGVWCAYGEHWWQADQVTDLGHSQYYSPFRYPSYFFAKSYTIRLLGHLLIRAAII